MVGESGSHASLSTDRVGFKSGVTVKAPWPTELAGEKTAELHVRSGGHSIAGGVCPARSSECDTEELDVPRSGEDGLA